MVTTIREKLKFASPSPCRYISRNGRSRSRRSHDGTQAPYLGDDMVWPRISMPEETKSQDPGSGEASSPENSFLGIKPVLH